MRRFVFVIAEISARKEQHWQIDSQEVRACQGRPHLGHTGLSRPVCCPVRRVRASVGVCAHDVVSLYEPAAVWQPRILRVGDHGCGRSQEFI